MTRIRSEVFVREDLEAILQASAFLIGTETTRGREAMAERRGAARMATAIARAIHIAPEPLVAQIMQLAHEEVTLVWPELPP